MTAIKPGPLHRRLCAELGLRRPGHNIATRRSALKGFLALAAAVVALLHVASPYLLGQSRAGTEVQTKPRPAMDVAIMLEGKYATPVTYEDPILRDASENIRFPFLPKQGLYVLPPNLRPSLTPKLDAAALKQALDLIASLNPDAPTFRVLESRYGLHVVPDTIHDENGASVRASSILDTVVSVPEERRLPVGHLAKLCEAVTSASGIYTWPNSMYANTYFLYDGSIRGMDLVIGTEDAQRRFAFAWGASGVTARDALVSLLDHSSTTLSWHVTCLPGIRSGDRDCALDLRPMGVEITGPDGAVKKDWLLHDRCITNCPPGQPGPANPPSPSGAQPPLHRAPPVPPPQQK